jgi:hypothetical protein
MKVEKPGYAVIDTQFSVGSNDQLALTWNLRSNEVSAIAGRIMENEQAGSASRIEKPTPPANHLEEVSASKKPIRPSSESRQANRRSSRAENTKIAVRGNEGSAAEKTAEELEAERAAVERSEREKRTAEESARARRSLQGLVDKYKSAFEAADLASLRSLLQFSETEADAWSKFFDLAKDVRVSIEDLDVQNDSDRAQIAFRAKLSYLNTSNSEQASNIIRNTWACENVGGRWVVVSHKAHQ